MLISSQVFLWQSEILYVSFKIEADSFENHVVLKMLFLIDTGNSSAWLLINKLLALLIFVLNIVHDYFPLL